MLIVRRKFLLADQDVRSQSIYISVDPASQPHKFNRWLGDATLPLECSDVTSLI